MAKQNKKTKDNVVKNETKNTEKKSVKKSQTDVVKSNKKTDDKKKVKNKTKRKSYVDEKQIEVSKEAKNAIWVTVVVFLVFIIFYFIAVKMTGTELIKKDEKEETEIQYEEILVGRSFDMGDDYYVIYYDMSDTENEELSELKTSISNFKSNNSDLKIYTCDLSNSFNKPYVTTNEPHTNPYGAEDLLLNGTTIIKFTNGTVQEYIYGTNEVRMYLDSFNTTE